MPGVQHVSAIRLHVRNLKVGDTVDDDVAGVEVNEVGDLVRREIELNRVVDLDLRVGVADRAAIVGDNVRDALGAESDLLDLEELVGRLLGRDAVDDEAALDIVKETEVLARLLNRENICRYLSECILPVQNTQERTHEARGVGVVGANLVVDLDQALHDDRRDLTTSERILQAVAQEDVERQGLAELMGTRRGAGRLCNTKR